MTFFFSLLLLPPLLNSARQHASLLVRVEECVCRCKELSLDILERETDMAVQCEPDRCGLRALQEKRDHLEVRGTGRDTCCVARSDSQAARR